MLNLALAAVSFTGLHLFVSGTRLRDGLIARLGEGPYRGLFSLASAAALGWLIWAYAAVRVPTPTPIPEWKGVADLLVLVAVLFITLGLLTFGPTAVGAEKLMDRDAHGVHRITRHPFLWGIFLWAATHMAFNPNLDALLFFGTFVVVAAAGTFSIDAKRARLYGERWRGYAAKTSNIPFAAIAQGRTRVALGEIGLIKPVIALLVFGFFAHFHAKFFGVSPFH